MKRLFFVVLFVILSSAITYASGEAEGHGGAKVINFGWRFLNFAVLVAVLYKLSAKAIKKFFVGKRELIKVSLEEAGALREEAQGKMNECAARLDKAAAEIDEMVDMIKAQGMAEKEKIIEDAKKAAEKMKVDAGSRVEQEFKKAVNQLKAEASELSVEIAEEILRKNVSKEDHEKIVQNFLDRMVSQN
ncbi:MAG: ATP synthase F0 subunit B [Syntrophaceae bacterium]|nr:ATP synthase F0 subunit B [Syntrophaceae bacterium]